MCASSQGNTVKSVTICQSAFHPPLICLKCGLQSWLRKCAAHKVTLSRKFKSRLVPRGAPPPTEPWQAFEKRLIRPQAKQGLEYGHSNNFDFLPRDLLPLKGLCKYHMLRSTYAGKATGRNSHQCSVGSAYTAQKASWLFAGIKSTSADKMVHSSQFLRHLLKQQSHLPCSSSTFKQGTWTAQFP